MFMNRGGHDLKTTNYGENFTFCNPELTSETCACLFYANRQNEVRKLFLDVDALWSVQTSGPYDTKQCMLRAEP